jgi:hypothetical protein
MKAKIVLRILKLKFLLKMMLSKDDAKALTDAKKDAYVKEKALEYVPVCYKTIRESINKMEYSASIHIEGPEFIPDIIMELDKVFQQMGYQTSWIGGRGNSRFFKIYWRDLTDDEKEGLL